MPISQLQKREENKEQESPLEDINGCSTHAISFNLITLLPHGAASPWLFSHSNRHRMTFGLKAKEKRTTQASPHSPIHSFLTLLRSNLLSFSVQTKSKKKPKKPIKPKWTATITTPSARVSKPLCCLKREKKKADNKVWNLVRHFLFAFPVSFYTFSVDIIFNITSSVLFSTKYIRWEMVGYDSCWRVVLFWD